MSQSALFKKLRAPLVNNRWSWGSIGENGDVILRVWLDECKNFEGKTYARITYYSKFNGREDDLGYNERLRHVEMLRNGSRAFMVMCVAKDDKEVPRVVKSYNDEEIFKANAIRLINEDWWLEVGARLKVITYLQLYGGA